MAHYKVLMVCMGNICRSPTAEGVLRHMVREAGLEGRVRIDSAGTHDYHVGSPPDERSSQHASLRGYDLSDQRARQVQPADFERFDLILAMDRGHVRELRRRCPEGLRGRVQLMGALVGAPEGDVPDPYYQDQDAFERVFELLDGYCRRLLLQL